MRSRSRVPTDLGAQDFPRSARSGRSLRAAARRAPSRVVGAPRRRDHRARMDERRPHRAIGGLESASGR